MSDGVKRPYSSVLRDEQAQATRRAVVKAAGRLFAERGYGATTIDAIAEEAGVGRKTVFTSVGGKAQALKLAIDWAIVGDDEPVALLDRAVVRAGMADPDPRHILAGFVHSLREIAGRIAPLIAVAEAAAGIDPEINALREESRTQRLTGIRVLAGVLADRSALKPDMTLDEAADVLWILSDPAIYTRLVIERRWEGDRYEDWLVNTLVTLLLTESQKSAF